MKTIVLFMAYYGKLPSYFDVWLKTVENNKTIDFIIISDLLDGKELPKNVAVKPYSFEEFKEVIQNKFDFQIKLDNYGRISQFRPAFGEIFSEDISGYDYWGYVECDLLLGDIRSFLTNDILEKYDKFFRTGHLQIFKNNQKMNSLYRAKSKSALNYRFAYSRNILFFEEGIGMHNLAVSQGCKSYTKQDFADVLWTEFPFYNTTANKNVGPLIFRYDNGKIEGYSIDGDGIEKKEYLYAHFQKRELIVYADSYDKFVIVPNKIINDTDINGELFEKMQQVINEDGQKYGDLKKKQFKKFNSNKYKHLDWWFLLPHRFRIRINGGVDL